jgi:DNA (cytosine-5)-methyltransferase 1
MKFFDLFCGIGGFRLGMETKRNVCIGSCEIDKYARQTYAKNFGHEPEYRDVREIKPGELPDFDCLCAGFPCQSFSLAGKRRGFEDTRGTLFFEIARIAREKQPSILLLENVKGLVSHDKGETFRIILETLDELGYDVEWQIINSKYFVPQNRERIFIIGHLRGSGRRKILPIGEGSDFDDQSCKESGGSGKGFQSQCDSGEQISTLTETYYKGWGGGRTVIAEPKLKLIQNSKDDSYRIYSTDGIARTLRANSGGLGSKTGVYAEPKTTMIMNANKNSNCKNRIQERDKTWALTGNSNDFSIMDNFRIRKLTPTECERLQGFPDGWTKGVSDTQRYRQLGNAVTATVVEYIAQYLDE